MPNLTEILKTATPEQLQKAGACKNAEELLTFAKAEGIDLTAEQAETVLKMNIPTSGELTDEELDNIAGGRNKECYLVTCPSCKYEFTATEYRVLSPGEFISKTCPICGVSFTTDQYSHT